MFGWPCDKEIEGLRDQFARESNPAKQKAIAEAVQGGLTQYPTHVPLGQWYGAVAVQKSAGGHDRGTGDRVLEHREEALSPNI